MTPPKLVVVGNANGGKSSVVSTLAADDRVEVSSIPGTTIECCEYPMKVDGKTIYILIDTPGFQRPDETLEWLKERESQYLDRADAVHAFVDSTKGDRRFDAERELLRPIVGGGFIIYVVDGSRPHTRRCEAEMEILHWTGARRIALINPIDGDQFCGDWRSVLRTNFNIVEEFNAHTVPHTRHVELLKTLAQVNSSSKDGLLRAAKLLELERQHKLADSAEIIARLIGDVVRTKVTIGYSKKWTKRQQRQAVSRLEEEYYAAIEKVEKQAHEDLCEVYAHGRLELNVPQLPNIAEALRSQRYGLTRIQLLAIGAMGGAAAGAAAGGIVDLGTGGTFLGTPTALGALIGGFVGAIGGYKKETTKDQLTMGPITGGNLPWVVLDRALLVHEHVANRTHAKRDNVQIENGGIVRNQPRERQRRFMAIIGAFRPPTFFEKLRSIDDRQVRQDLESLIMETISSLDIAAALAFAPSPSGVVTNGSPADDESGSRP